MIVKLPKKGDLHVHECTNWRGITMLPVINKIFGRVMISRVKKGVDNEYPEDGKSRFLTEQKYMTVQLIRSLLSGIY